MQSFLIRQNIIKGASDKLYDAMINTDVKAINQKYYEVVA